MGKKWDYDVPSVEVWKECLRVLKPGGHLLAFAGTRTQHRMAVRIEDAGFEIRDMIAWVYGSGFPKSHNLKEEMQGWGTALKPALEPITVARKPLGEKTVAANVLEHGTGALNVDGCRVGTTVETWPKSRSYCESGGIDYIDAKNNPTRVTQSTGDAPAGRWPANLIHDGSDEVDSLLNSAARFFYCAKASKRDRDEGCEGLAAKANPKLCDTGYESPTRMDGKPCAVQRNHHPTVKPTALMRYLCRLVTPPGGVVLDPFMGSGSTGKAAMLEGFNFIGIEREESYIKIAEARINSAKTPA
jgi:site-specific DNA-methyltransferase (adenine-specific)